MIEFEDIDQPISLNNEIFLWQGSLVIWDEQYKVCLISHKSIYTPDLLHIGSTLNVPSTMTLPANIPDIERMKIEGECYSNGKYYNYFEMEPYPRLSRENSVNFNDLIRRLLDRNRGLIVTLSADRIIKLIPTERQIKHSDGVTHYDLMHCVFESSFSMMTQPQH